MGAWGTGSFENDGASDWMASCYETSGTDFIKYTFLAVLNTGEDYLEIDESTAGVAAAETLAALKDGITSNLPKELKRWVSKQQVTIDSDLISLALVVIDSVLSDSELKELWEESDEASKWLSTVDALKFRLTQMPDQLTYP